MHAKKGDTERKSCVKTGLAGTKLCSPPQEPASRLAFLQQLAAVFLHFCPRGDLNPCPLDCEARVLTDNASAAPRAIVNYGKHATREKWQRRGQMCVHLIHPGGPLHFQIHAIYSVLQEHVSVFTLQYSAKKLPSNNQEARDEFTDLHSGYVLKLTIASYPTLQRLFNINDGLKRVRTRYHRSIGNCRTSKRCKGRYAMYLTSAHRV